MPQTLTGTSTYSNTVSAPVDGDLASSASIVTPLQSLLNTTKAIYDIITTGGVSAVRSVADTTALKTLTGMATGSTAIVRGQGTYVFDSTATFSFEPETIAPNIGTGRWVRAMSRNKYVLYETEGYLSSTSLLLSTAYQDVYTRQGAYGAVMTAGIGEYVEVMVTGYVYCPSNVSVVGVDVQLTGGASSVVLGDSKFANGTTLFVIVPFTLIGQYSIDAADVTAGSMYWKVKAKSTVDAAATVHVRNFRSRHVRP